VEVSLVEQSLQIRLPPAPPDHYLRWMAFWREVEQAMATRPAFEHHASSVSAPFLRGAVAEYLSGVMCTEIIRQAVEAKRAGAKDVRPVITGGSDILLEAVETIRRRGRWMDETLSLEAAGVNPLEPEFVELRKRAVRVMELAIIRAADHSRAPGAA
jgi:hypothetical protein